MAKMSYEERLARYEEDKQKLYDKNLTASEYQREIIKLANKWGV